jgi:hypothetical protein
MSLFISAPGILPDFAYHSASHVILQSKHQPIVRVTNRVTPRSDAATLPAGVKIKKQRTTYKDFFWDFPECADGECHIVGMSAMLVGLYKLNIVYP